MCPETRGVEDNAFVRGLVDNGGVSAPQVPVNQRRLNLPPPTLQRPQEPRNDVVKEHRSQHVELLIRPGPLLSHRQYMPQTFIEEGFPAVGPGVVLREVAVVRRAVEAELALGRRVAGVQTSQLLAERDGLGHALGEVIELTNVEVGVRIALERAPSDWPWAEVGRDLVDGRCRLEFALESVQPRIASRDLVRLSDRRARGPFS